jgi:signal transduction histidine kinase
VKSFRVSVLLGCLLWSLALLALAHMMFLLVVFHRFPVSHRIIAGCAVVVMSAGAGLVSAALVPFRRLRVRLVEIREGRNQKITGSFPSEIQPLVDDLNSLLAQRERAVRSAQAKAGDLAHGLKTPLAIIAQEAERVQRKGELELADTLGQQVERMRQQIEYHLAQARAAGSGKLPGVRSSLRTSADRLVRTLQRLYADRGISFRIDVAEDHFVQVEQEDLEEMLGNLLDNACKWGKSEVALSSQPKDDKILIVVEDNSTGISEAMRNAVLERGVRADETTPGSGLGLAIVKELIELYGGSIWLGDSASGGLKVSVLLPRAAQLSASDRSRTCE